MRSKNSWEIQKDIRKDEVQYIVDWSPWGTMDRWVINRRIPSEAGLFQLWVKENKNFTLLVTEPTYYGGLRNSLREVIDEMAPSGGRLREIIAGRECFFRFSTCSSRNQLIELNDWFASGGGGEDSEDREIFVNERDDLRKFPPPPPDVKAAEREGLKDSDFGPYLPGGTD